jgi:hypothetical protein
MQNKTRLELADYEAENLAKLQKLLTRKWEFIYMQAEAQIKVDKKRDKMERKVIDSQERAFWDVHRPVPGCVNTTECDMKKTLRKRVNNNYHKNNYLNVPQKNQITARSERESNATSSSQNNHKPININKTISATITATLTATVPLFSSSAFSPINSVTSPPASTISENDEVLSICNLRKDIDFLKRRLERRYVKISKVSERFDFYFHAILKLNTKKINLFKFDKFL